MGKELDKEWIEKKIKILLKNYQINFVNLIRGEKAKYLIPLNYSWCIFLYGV